MTIIILGTFSKRLTNYIFLFFFFFVIENFFVVDRVKELIKYMVNKAFLIF